MSLKELLSEQKGQWTLFLDRDGVINQEFGSDYICRSEDFHFAEGAPEAISHLRPLFERILIVTNQRGIGIGQMTESDLEQIHLRMLEIIHQAGGKIDHIFFCPDADRNSTARKPHPAMALRAKEKYPEINFSRSIMVGNSESDMDFGKSMGMYTVFIDDKKRGIHFKKENMDYFFDSLASFARSFENL